MVDLSHGLFGWEVGVMKTCLMDWLMRAAKETFSHLKSQWGQLERNGLKFFPRWSLNYWVQSFQKLVKLPYLNITTFYWSLILRSRLKISNSEADVKLCLIQELGYPIHIYIFNFFSFHFIFMIKYPTFVQLIYKANVKAVSFCS